MPYQTVKELHIAIDQELQYIDSNRKDSIKPEQKDWVLNSALIQLIKNKINPNSNVKQIGFEENLKRYDDLAALKSGLIFKDTYVDSKGKYCILPSDYLNIISSNAVIINDCNHIINNVGTSTLLHMTKAVFKPISGNTISDFKLYHNGILIYDYTTFGYTLNNYQSKYIIVRDVLDKFKSYGNFDVYWERYDNVYEPDTFIFISKVATIFNVRYNTLDHIYNSSIFGYVQNLYSETGLLRQNDIRSSDNLTNDINSKYRSSRYYKPISWIEGRRIYVNETSDYKVKQVVIEYFKRPQLINIYTNQTCELPHLTEEIVSLAVQKLKAYINDSNYQLINKENLNIE